MSAKLANTIMDAAYHIRLATQRDVALLPAIELAAARLFLDRIDALGLTPEMLESTNSAVDFARAQQAGRLWVAVAASSTTSCAAPHDRARRGQQSR